MEADIGGLMSLIILLAGHKLFICLNIFEDVWSSYGSPIQIRYEISATTKKN